MNTFFVVRRQLEGTAMAYRFGRGSFTRGEVVKIASVNRSKGYFNFATIANLAGFSWYMDFDVGPTGSQVVAANSIMNGAFDANITGWASAIGTGVTWNAADGGVMRVTRDATLAQRWRWITGVAAVVNDGILYAYNVVTTNVAAGAFGDRDLAVERTQQYQRAHAAGSADCPKWPHQEGGHG